VRSAAADQVFPRGTLLQGEGNGLLVAAGAGRRAESGEDQAKINAGAVAFWRQGSPDLGEFEDAVILKAFGDVPDDFRFVT
jgi:hypothetical protein